jgi:hypothetical protein
MDKPSEFNLAVTQALVDMKPYFDSHSKHRVHTQQFFTEIAKATIIKSYEFACSVDVHEANYVFFSLPALRGICEEYIAEKFLFEQFHEQKDEIIYLRHICDHLKSSIVQWKYFEIYRADQNLYYEDDFPDRLKDAEHQLRNLIKSKLPEISSKSVFPSVHYMSKQTGLLELYNYLYHATSTFVHFSPNNLLRMGWGDLPDIQFSAANFKNYYRDFCLFYSVLLLGKLCEWQEANGFLPGFDTRHISTLNDILQRAQRWPELVTFEEMNIGAFSKNIIYKSPNRAKKTI